MLRILLVFALLICSIASQAQAASLVKLEKKYKSAVVMDISTGEILYAHNENEQIIPASLVKMMVALIAVEKILKRQIWINLGLLNEWIKSGVHFLE